MLLQSFIGGLVIGTGAALLLLGRGQIAGISGLVGNLLEGQTGPRQWRLFFLAGLLLPALFWRATGGQVPGALEPGWLLLGAGVLVGFGTRLGNGCTSGHGLCGLGNLSTRSLVATATFMAVAFLTVFVVRHVLGAA